MPIFQPRRIRWQTGRYALVDTIPFKMPVEAVSSAAIIAAFPIDANKVRPLLQGNEIHPFILWNRGLLIVTVIDYRATNIGKYIEFSIAIACTHGRTQAPPLLPALMMGAFGTGQWVYDLPVSSEISVKGGKGIWGMPKHQANLDFAEGERWITSQYDLDGELAMRLEVQRPERIWLPLNFGATNYCGYRGMLMKSTIYFNGKAGVSLFRDRAARIILGNSPRIQALKSIGLEPNAVATMYLPKVNGVLDDHIECWFLSNAAPFETPPEGAESVINLGLSQQWLPPPNDPAPGEQARSSE
ncbi:MAG TPA: acetoacetate decarboxylase family protein [Candidatus Binataceae bacterium]|nr:acetoacetate decarboxylase family protein [Candidatus Binataceae bacterium]